MNFGLRDNQAGYTCSAPSGTRGDKADTCLVYTSKEATTYGNCAVARVHADNKDKEKVMHVFDFACMYLCIYACMYATRAHLRCVY